MKAMLELTVAELDCADEARQIEGTLSRLPGVAEVRTAVSARRAVVGYDPERLAPETIRRAIQDLGMTVTDARTPVTRPRRSLPDLIGWGFVSLIAIVTLVGIVGERLGVLEAVTSRIPPWLSVAAVLIGGYPIFRKVVRALRNRTINA